jgi:hypothetical protein
MGLSTVLDVKIELFLWRGVVLIILKLLELSALNPGKF